jgi:hypothetical protein
MRRAALTALLALPFALAAFAGCAESASKLCREVCQREHDCVEEREDEEEELLRFDRGECVTTCAALERDEVGSEIVKRHAECVDQASSCDQVLACP